MGYADFGKGKSNARSVRGLLILPWFLLLQDLAHSLSGDAFLLVECNDGIPVNRISPICLRCPVRIQILFHGNINGYCLCRVEVEYCFNTVFGSGNFKSAKVTFGLQGIGLDLFSGDGTH